MQPPNTPPSGPSSEEPSLDEAVRQIGAAGKTLGTELWGVGTAFRDLFMADLALSRSALLRVLALSGLSVVLGTTAWLYLMAMGVLGLRAMGLPWWVAVGAPALVSLLGMALCVWLALRALDDSRFNATRRQLARFGIGDGAQQSDDDSEKTG